MARTKKVGSAGRLRANYGAKIRHKVAAIERKQRAKQQCPYCKKFSVKRLASGIFYCKTCDKKFTGGAYFVKRD